MKDIFKIIETRSEKDGRESGVRAGIHVTIAGRSEFWPLTKVCRSSEELAAEVSEIRENLESMVEKGRLLFASAEGSGQSVIDPDMMEEEVWRILSEMDQADLKSQFNVLDEDKRKAIAEYVLTKTNIFSGRASFFSASYNSESALIE